jgi:hypothetical protein
MAVWAQNQLEKEGVMEIIVIIIAFGLILNAIANLWLEGQRG